MSDIQIVELEGPEAKAALKASCLDLMRAGEPANAAFYAAHKSTESIAVLIYQEHTFVWRLTGGTESNRRIRCQNVRDQYGARD